MVISCANNAAESSTLDPAALKDFSMAYLRVSNGFPLDGVDSIQEVHDTYAKSYDDKVFHQGWWIHPQVAYFRPIEAMLEMGWDPVIERLLNVKKVSTCYRAPDNRSTIHFWLTGMMNRPSEKKKEFLKQLCAGGAQINALDNTEQTPLRMAIGEVWYNSKDVPFSIIPLLFDHGASLLADENGKTCNALKAFDIQGQLGMMVKVLHARSQPLEVLRKDAEFYCLLFYRINHSRNGSNKVPRVLSDYIIDLVNPGCKKRLADGIADIRKSVADRHASLKSFNKKKVRERLFIRVVQPSFWSTPKSPETSDTKRAPLPARSFRQAAQALEIIMAIKDFKKVTKEQIKVLMPKDLVFGP
jgi:hypothetical protein